MIAEAIAAIDHQQRQGFGQRGVAYVLSQAREHGHLAVADRQPASLICSTRRRSGSVPVQLMQQQVAVAIDDRQQVIEIVRDAACELPHGLHLLRVPKLLLEAFSNTLTPYCCRLSHRAASWTDAAS